MTDKPAENGKVSYHINLQWKHPSRLLVCVWETINAEDVLRDWCAIFHRRNIISPWNPETRKLEQTPVQH